MLVLVWTEAKYICDPIRQKGTSCRPGLFWDNGQNRVQNIQKIKGNTDLVNIVFLKVALQIFKNLVSWESLLNLLIDHAKISILSKVNKMYLLVLGHIMLF